MNLTFQGESVTVISSYPLICCVSYMCTFVVKKILKVELYMATIRFTDNDKSGGKLVNSFFTKECSMISLVFSRSPL